MAADPYQTLGVAKDATPEQIRTAFRNLAKQHHPDLNPGNKKAEDRFKAVSAANELLSDPERRARFDRGEIDAAGQERPERYGYRYHADAAEGARYRPGMPPEEDPAFAEIFSEMFPRGGGQGSARARMRGQDQQYRLEVDFTEAALGAQRRLTLPDGRTLDVAIPPGLEDGQVLRLRGQGGAGWNDGPPGDALIEVGVRPHRHLRREGRDLHLDLPVTVAEAVLGAKVPVPTLGGSLTLTIPRHSDAGRVLRLRGQGLPAQDGAAAGDLYVRLSLVAGTPDAALETALQEWRDRHADDPRPSLAEAG